MSFKAKFAGECPVRAKFNSETPIKARFQSFQRINSGAVVLSDTTENWNKQASLISELNTIYVYVDHQTKTDAGQFFRKILANGKETADNLDNHQQKNDE